MKEIKLTQGYVAFVDDEDYEWLNQWRWKPQIDQNNVYAVRNIRFNNKYKAVRMHRFIMNAPDDMLVDHIDSDGLNNQKYNLRLCNDYQNRLHRKPNKNHKYIGVGVYKNIFRARIRINNTVYYLGYFKTEKEAAIAYNNAAIKLKREFAFINKL
jgi:hypothetical protein